MLKLAVVLLALLAGCFQSSGLEASNADDEGPSPGSFRGCDVDDDCTPAAATCCECPSFAVPTGDPLAGSCSDVDCPVRGEVCAPVTAVCDAGACVLACEPQQCSQSCENGYALDPSGCLSCECAPPVIGGCTVNSDCVQTRADCCGCAAGGADTAVLAQERATFEAMLGCSSAPQCPGVDVCASAGTPQCVQGRCELLAGGVPPDACGRPDLAACPPGTVCTVNASDVANMQGLGVCKAP
ncbi:MAG: hypothetical protein M3680_24300 [Myxococcota bacterium]|nr:hypothetical protein [Myxococcota bacterium]